MTIAANVLLSLLAVAVSTAVLRPPTVQRIEPRTVHQVAPAPNLLLSTLGQPAARPFVQTDWPLPRAAQHPTELRTWLDVLKSNLLVPFAQRDWPVPWAAAQPVELKTWIDPLKIRLLTPFAQRDWALPRGVAAAPLADPPNLLTTTLAPAAPVAVPFSQLDWTLPRARAQAIQTDAPNLLTGTLARRDAPFAQFDWPLPRAVAAAQPGVERNLLTGPLVSKDAPFAQREWPLPTGVATTGRVDWLAPNTLVGFTAIDEVKVIVDWIVSQARGRGRR